MFLSFPECQCVAIFKNRQEKKKSGREGEEKAKWSWPAREARMNDLSVLVGKGSGRDVSRRNQILDSCLWLSGALLNCKLIGTSLVVQWLGIWWLGPLQGAQV